MRIVRTRSIPNVDSERLITDLKTLHHIFHTPEGIHGFDGNRREMFDNCRKAMAIRDELKTRSFSIDITCRFCGS